MGVTWRIPGGPGSVEELPNAAAALEYARAVHACQTRKCDGAPFIAHPSEVAALLYESGASDELIAAGALHDVIEKTATSAFDLRRRFGSRIAVLVLAVSDDSRIRRYAPRKAALRERVADAGEEALTLFAADKVSKVRELQSPAKLSVRERLERRRRLVHYTKSLELLRSRLPDSPLVAQLAAELKRVSPRRHFDRPRSELRRA